MVYAPTNASRLMTAHCTFSALSYAPEEYTTESFAVLIPFLPTSESRRAAHTARALKALEIYTKMLAIPSAHEKHSVLQLSTAAHSATLQISAIQNLLDDRALEIGRERLKLMIGFFNTMGNYWPLVRTAANEIKMIARAAFAAVRETAHVSADTQTGMPLDELA
jgi:hypothetical protein